MIIDRHPLSGLPIIKEERRPGRWRALPKDIGARAHQLQGQTTGSWWPGYQDIDSLGIAMVGCMKCRTPIQGFQPKLYRPEASKPDSQAVYRYRPLPQGKQGVEVALLPYTHFRMGMYEYRWANDRLPSRFEFIHCADCHIKDEDGPNLLVCCLAGLDDTREWSAKLNGRRDPTDHEHATHMWRFSQPVEFIGVAGSSLSIKDLMAGKG